jgi:F-type H+-transporting ATPase subunit b
MSLWFLGVQLASLAAFASEGGEGAEGGIPSETIVYSAINLIIFLGLLGYFASRPIGDALKSRALTVRSGLDEAARLQQDASQRFSDVEAKLVALGRQVEEMKSEARTSADREAEVLRERADAEVIRLRESAERTIREETLRATASIRGEAASMAVALAKEMLKNEVSVEDQQNLARQFLAMVEKEAPRD